ncbi:MAG: dihydrolipoamide acetyltransferase family protein [Steroidobacteraceae bacterium]
MTSPAATRASSAQVVTFKLPDLGEGLPEAEIVTWHVGEGDEIKVDQPMVSVETAKAVVEIPSPYTARVVKLHAKAGQLLATGQPLIDLETHAPVPTVRAQDEGMVVGRMATSDEEIVEPTRSQTRKHAIASRVRAAPAVRMLAKRLQIDLAQIRGTGRHGLITVADVLDRMDREPARPRIPLDAFRSLPPMSDADRLRGPRRAMSSSMSLSRDEVAMCTVFDDADIEAWTNRNDVTPRLIRAIVAGVRAEPALNALFDPAGPSRKLMRETHLALAIDTGDGLIVPVIRDIASKHLDALRSELASLKERTRARSIAPEDMRDFTISLSNFGMLAGRYATPLVVPPTVAILGAGRLQRDVVAGATAPEIHTRIPLSLTFDHRCITGGEACRFLAAVMTDLAKPE